jgi:hypothetical protein
MVVFIISTKAILRHLPLDPAVVRSELRVYVTTTRTPFLIGRSLPHHNAHLELHSRLHHIAEFRSVHYLAIFSAYHFIVTPFNKGNPGAISAIKLDDIVEILNAEVVSVNH